MRSTHATPVAVLRRTARRPARPGSLLIAVAVALALVLFAVGAVLARRNEGAEYDRQLAQSRMLAHAAAAEADSFLREQLALLDAITVIPGVQLGDLEAMRYYFTALRVRQPAFATVLWADLSGVARASAVPDPAGMPVNVADRDYFQSVIATGQPFVSAAVIGRFTQQPVVVLAVPTRDSDGRLSGVLAAGITLTQMERLLAAFHVGETGILLVVDRAGQLIVDADPASGIQDVAASPLLGQVRARGRGVMADTRGLRGETGRLVGFDAAPIANWAVLVQRSGDEAFGPARRTFTSTLSALFGLVLLAVLGGVWAGRRLNTLAMAQQQALVASEELAAANAQLYEQEQAARREAEAARLRLAFVAQASATLASSLDYQTTLNQLVRLAVPSLADWCTVHIIQEEGGVQRAALAHFDPVKEVELRAIRQRFPLEANPRHPVIKALRYGRAAYYPDVTEELLEAIAPSDEQRRRLLAVGIGSYICLPLVARERTLGAIVFVAAESGRRYGLDDLRLAEDLARRAALAIDNARLYHEAQEAVRIREHFLAAVSHDLRTPLTSMKAYAQLLQRRMRRLAPAEWEQFQEGLRAIEAGAVQMSALVGELLDVAQLEHGQPLRLEQRPTDLVGLVEREVDRFTQAAPRHQLRVDTTVPELVGDWDPDRLSRVLTNLLSNAVKYSPMGGAVSAFVDRAHADQAPGDWAVLQVKDEGVGIPPADLPHIFERFHRGANVGRIEGMGLGLAGVKQIVEQHGGSIVVESQEGGGTTVTVRLPLHQAARVSESEAASVS